MADLEMNCSITKYFIHLRGLKYWSKTRERNTIRFVNIALWITDHLHLKPYKQSKLLTHYRGYCLWG